MEEVLEEALLLVVLLKELLAKATLLGGKVEELLVVELAAEVFGQLLCHDAASLAYLAANVDDDFLIVHITKCFQWVSVV